MSYITVYNLYAMSVDFEDMSIPMDVADTFRGAMSEVLSQAAHHIGGSGKWYHYSEDMIKASREHPGVLFNLIGCGEDDFDIWEAYYLNGIDWEWHLNPEGPSFEEALEELDKKGANSHG